MRLSKLILSSVKLAASAAITVCTWAVTIDAAAAERPNILLIVVDDMGYSDVGAFGGEI